ncbi:hypothetical protein EJ08DRAFT_595457 [Tothia fuscella]|uniref:Altered inheritance of mitochondria protein 6 n=1 Tax=Tothia fuscella TaxID=1048955 RepID=A0A9P4NJ74_9PEZI|nr:hypothetical protein EJ08DRAFT_595457 [Tothia fuscella]
MANTNRVWLALINTLLSRLAPAALGNGVETVVKNWRSSGDAQKIIPWPADFSRDVIPVQCHSHNDYWRKVPLFDALAAGCVSVEADIWNEQGSDELLVGHSKRALKAERTLRSLYLDPIMHILKATNNGTSANETVGVFETAPNTTLVLLLDFKTDGANTWPLVQTHLEPLREKEWLTRWDATTKSRRLGLVTVVATGKAPFDLVTSSTTKDIFFDAPLDNLDKTDQYTAENSYFASVSMGKAIGNVRHDLSVTQLVQVEKQISLAEQKALVSRYWDTPSWPMSTRNRVWQTLVDHGVGILNVDSLETATRWDWKICSVGGLRICG